MRISGQAVLALLLLGAPAPVRADGVMFPRATAGELVLEEAQEAWLEHASGREKLVLAVNPGKAEPDMVWLVPLPARGSQTTLSLTDSLPDWGGEEVRIAGQLALHPGTTVFFFVVLAIAGAGAGQWAVAVGIVFLLQAIAIPSFGPGTGRMGDDVRTFQRRELGGLAAELAEASTLAGFEEYLAAKSCALPAAVKGPVDAHIKTGGAFAVAWAKDAAADKALALSLEFPAERPWYPVRLTAAYGRAKTPIDLHLSGWWKPEGEPESAKVGYYSGGAQARRHTRVVYQGRAEGLKEDWTFAPRGASADLRLAEAVSRFPVILLLVMCLLSGVLTGLTAFPDWRSLAGLKDLFVFGMAGALPFLGPAVALRHLRSETDGVPPFPLPEGMSAEEVRRLKRWGMALMAAGLTCELGLTPLLDAFPPLLIGAVLSGAGVASYLRGKGYPWAAAGGYAFITAPTVLIGPLLCAVPKHPRQITAELGVQAAGFPKAAPDPVPDGMDEAQIPKWKQAGALLMALGMVVQIVDIAELESGGAFMAGCFLNGVGAAVFMRARGLSWLKAGLFGAAASWTVVFGPLLCAAARAEAPRPLPGFEPPEQTPAERRWRTVALASSGTALALNLGVVFALGRLWASDDNTARISYRGDLLARSLEGATRANLELLRAAVAGYQEDNAGNSPAGLEVLLKDGKYLSTAAIPPAKLSRLHGKNSNAVAIGEESEDRGGWLYDPKTGTVKVDCTHTDTKGSAWDSY